MRQCCTCRFHVLTSVICVLVTARLNCLGALEGSGAHPNTVVPMLGMTPRRQGGAA